MEYGHVVISNTKKGLIQSLIRFFTQSKFSHSFFTTPPVCGKEMAIEAGGSGVAAIAFDTHYRKNPKVAYRVYRFLASSELKDKAIGAALEELQLGYGYLEILWFAWRGLNKYFGRDIKHQRNWSQAGIICSELTASYIEGSGCPGLFAAYGTGSINAQDILEICEANKSLFELIETKE